MASSNMRRMVTIGMSELPRYSLERSTIGPHAFLKREVLCINTLNAREGLRLLNLTVDHEVIRKIALQSEGTGNNIVLAAPIIGIDRILVFICETDRGVIGRTPN